MRDVRVLPRRLFVLGDRKNIGILIERADGSASSATATVSLYDSAGSVVLGETNMTISGTVALRAKYLLRTGAGEVVSSPGTYRAIYRVTDLGQTQQAQQVIEVAPVPF